jgi:hypothetical protein
MAELELLTLHLSIVNLVYSSFYKAKIDIALSFFVSNANRWINGWEYYGLRCGLWAKLSSVKPVIPSNIHSPGDFWLFVKLELPYYFPPYPLPLHKLCTSFFAEYNWVVYWYFVFECMWVSEVFSIGSNWKLVTTFCENWNVSIL